MKLDKQACKLLRERINSALAPLAKELGISLVTGNVTFDRNGAYASFKVDAATFNGCGEIETKEARDYRNYFALFNLPEDGLFKIVTFNGKEFTIIGLLPRSDKFPLIGRTADGKQFKLPARALGAPVTVKIY